jgi:hypothetical protein
MTNHLSNSLTSRFAMAVKIGDCTAYSGLPPPVAHEIYAGQRQKLYGRRFGNPECEADAGVSGDRNLGVFGKAQIGDEHAVHVRADQHRTVGCNVEIVRKEKSED